MLELHPALTDVVGCFARAAALDPIADAAPICVRVAPDELLILGAQERLAEIRAELREADVDSLALDLSGGYAIWSLRGDDRFEAFCRLSAVAVPPAPATIQGLVAQVPTKVLVRDDELVLIVSSAVAHHLRRRVLAACADLGPVEGEDVEIRAVAEEVVAR